MEFKDKLCMVNLIEDFADIKQNNVGCNIFKRLYVYALFISSVHKMEDNVTKQRTSLRNVSDITV